MVSSRDASGGGVYNVKDSGLVYDQGQSGGGGNLQPVSPEEFLQEFKDNFQIRVLEHPSVHELVLEFIHVDVSFVNALRRILISEIPTVALEHVYMWNNTSIIHDEVLAHRLGLIPLTADARLMEEFPNVPTNTELSQEDDDGEGDASPTDRNTVVFRLAVSCTKQEAEEHYQDLKTKKKAVRGARNPRVRDETGEQSVQKVDDDEVMAGIEEAAQAGKQLQFPPDRPFTKHVYSKDLIWVPQGDQSERFPEGIRPIHDDILIAKLRPGQAIELEAHGRRGIGKDHAKFSPVATASYRLMPCISIVQPIYDELAEELVHIYEPGVFDLIPTDPRKGDPPGKRCKAVMVNPYACTMSRNYMRNPVLKESIRMSRLADHFIFSIESVGSYPAEVLLAEALRILQKKCVRLMFQIQQSQDKAKLI